MKIYNAKIYTCDEQFTIIENGYAEIDGGRYYFEADGRMASGCTDVDGSRYCLGTDGRMITGWVREKGILYCLGEDGALRTSSWIEEDKGTYYVDKEGHERAPSRNSADTTKVDGASGYIDTYLFGDLYDMCA